MIEKEKEKQQDIADFERTRLQLLNISSQKQQQQFHSRAIGAALEELEKTTEKKVYKAVGNILILSDTAKVRKELKEQKESLDLRIKTLQKQEDSSVDKLNKLKTRIEGPEKEVKEQEEK